GWGRRGIHRSLYRGRYLAGTPWRNRSCVLDALLFKRTGLIRASNRWLRSLVSLKPSACIFNCQTAATTAGASPIHAALSPFTIEYSAAGLDCDRFDAGKRILER